MAILRVALPVPPTTHRLKYRPFYGREGVRIVGHDNERGKADHRHIHGREVRYRIVAVEQLIGDFLTDVERERSRT